MMPILSIVYGFAITTTVSALLLLPSSNLHSTAQNNFRSVQTAPLSVRNHNDDENANLWSSNTKSGNVTLLCQCENYLVACKPPSVVCHHSQWTGSKANQEVPMLQRTREALGRRVNLIHRLDRGCSGCLLMTFADTDNSQNNTATLSHAMAQSSTRKTYVAIVRGEGILKGRDFRKEGWFRVSRPIKNERGIINNATTWFRFVAGQDNEQGLLDRPRASIVLARPETGRWHQIRKHLNGLSHPILGDSIHGNSRVNREWKTKYGMPPERTCLHLVHLRMEPNCVCHNGINVSSPLAPDMLKLLKDHLPNVLARAKPILEEEGVSLESTDHHTTLPYELII